MDNWEAETLNISGIVDDSIVDGPGLRYTIFVQGCPHGCPECHNPQTHSFEENKRVTLGQLMSEIKEMCIRDRVMTMGLCRLGYYGELQEQIIRDLGYNFEMINLAEYTTGKNRDYLKALRRINPKMSLAKLDVYKRQVVNIDQCDPDMSELGGAHHKICRCGLSGADYRLCQFGGSMCTGI